MNNQITISAESTDFSVELNNDSLGREILDALPFESRVSTWGDEIYFPIPVSAEPDTPTKEVNIGDVAYWSPGKSLAVFFGPTPMSEGDKPVPADAVDLVGSVVDGIDTLEQIAVGETLELRLKSD